MSCDDCTNSKQTTSVRHLSISRRGWWWWWSNKIFHYWSTLSPQKSSSFFGVLPLLFLFVDFSRATPVTKEVTQEEEEVKRRRRRGQIEHTSAALCLAAQFCAAADVAAIFFSGHHFLPPPSPITILSNRSHDWSSSGNISRGERVVQHQRQDDCPSVLLSAPFDGDSVEALLWFFALVSEYSLSSSLSTFPHRRQLISIDHNYYQQSCRKVQL